VVSVRAPIALLPPVPIVQEAGWAPEPVWTQRLEEKSFVPAGDRTSIARSSIVTKIKLRGFLCPLVIASLFVLDQGWGTFSCWKAAFKKLQLDILKNVHYFVKI
jgi:hypothetical protein